MKRLTSLYVFQKVLVTLCLVFSIVSCELLTLPFAEDLNNPVDPKVAKKAEKEASSIVFADGEAVSKHIGSGIYINLVSGAGSGLMTYSSGTPATASVNTSTGAVTLVGVGTTLIIANKAATATHASVTNTYTLTVSNPELADGTKIGDSYQGGKLAYIFQAGDPGYDSLVEKGLIAATADQSTPIIWAVVGCQITDVEGAYGTEIGTGLTNTYAIIAQNDPTSTGLITYAAGLAHAYNGGGYSDWYLPSKDELNKLYLNRVAIGGFVAIHYWSSSAYDSDDAYLQFFDHGLQGANYKNNSYNIRPVRTFYNLIPSTILFADGTTVSKKIGSGTYVNSVTGAGSGTITYSSGTTTTATVDANTGVVTPVGVGTTIISAVKTATVTHSTVTSTYTLTVSAAGIYAIGDTGPSGVGKVFYITNGGLNGMEAAPNTWNGGTVDPTAQWKTANIDTAGTSTAIGAGYANTYTYMIGAEHPAAALCRAYTGGGRNDWFLPSKDELNQMYLQKENIGGFLADLFWSSSQLDSNLAWSQSFTYGGVKYYYNKGNFQYVRPVRAF